MPNSLRVSAADLLDSLQWLVGSILVPAGGGLLDITVEYDQKMRQLCFALEIDDKGAADGGEVSPQQDRELVGYGDLKKQIESIGGLLISARSAAASLYRLRFPAAGLGTAAVNRQIQKRHQESSPRQQQQRGDEKPSEENMACSAQPKKPHTAQKIAAGAARPPLPKEEKHAVEQPLERKAASSAQAKKPPQPQKHAAPVEQPPAAKELGDAAVQHTALAQEISAVEFINVFPNEFRKITSAYNSGAWREVVFKTNKMAGAAAICGFTEMQTILLSFEERSFPSQAGKIEEDLESLISAFKKRQREFNLASDEEILLEPVAAPAENEPTTIVSELVETCPDLVSLIVEFLNEVEGYIEDMEAAAQRADWNELRAIAHDAAGAAGIYGFPQYRQAADELCTAVKQQNPAGIDASLDALKELTEAIVKGKRYLEERQDALEE
jgi:HPt (histidine-containing phosphotransfer) domain-containing protein